MTRVPYAGDEKASLHASLDRHRDAIVWKLEGTPTSCASSSTARPAITAAPAPVRRSPPGPLMTKPRA